MTRDQLLTIKANAQITIRFVDDELKKIDKPKKEDKKIINALIQVERNRMRRYKQSASSH